MSSFPVTEHSLTAGSAGDPVAGPNPPARPLPRPLPKVSHRKPVSLEMRLGLAVSDLLRSSTTRVRSTRPGCPGPHNSRRGVRRGRAACAQALAAASGPAWRRRPTPPQTRRSPMHRQYQGRPHRRGPSSPVPARPRARFRCRSKARDLAWETRPHEFVAVRDQSSGQVRGWRRGPIWDGRFWRRSVLASS